VKKLWLVAALMAAAGCGNGVPELSALTYSPNAGVVGSVASISIAAKYNDSDNDISQWEVELLWPDSTTTETTGMLPLTGTGMGNMGDVNVSIMFTPMQQGYYFFWFWIIDLPGNESNKLRGTIKVAPPSPPFM
jgi:hypothetical protein